MFARDLPEAVDEASSSVQICVEEVLEPEVGLVELLEDVTCPSAELEYEVVRPLDEEVELVV